MGRLKSVTDSRVLRNREGLRQALLELLEAKTFDLITIRDVVAVAKVGYTTYFRYYPNKEALLGDVAIQEVSKLHEITLPVYRARDSKAACVAVCRYVDQRRRVWSALLYGAPEYVRKEMLRLGREDTAALTTHARNWLPQGLGLVLSVAVMVELLGWWLAQPKPLPVARIAQIMNRVAITPSQGH
jgi:AcrR family transcriptional regulator